MCWQSLTHPRIRICCPAQFSCGHPSVHHGFCSRERKKIEREKQWLASTKKSYFEYHPTELNYVQAPMITWHYHRWTERRWILHSISSISARLLLRQETWKQSLGTLLEEMSESLCHAVKCWALYCVLSVWAWNYSKSILPLFVLVCVHVFARYAVICGKNVWIFLCLWVSVLNFVTLFSQRKLPH